MEDYLKKPYKAILFDWDGTAIVSRGAPVDQVIPCLNNLLEKGIKLVIISGTTYNNIAHGQLEELIPAKLSQNLFLGLGRGAFNYGFDKDGKLVMLHQAVPDTEELLKIHKVGFAIHQLLLADYNMLTDIVFSRPNYCKIDLLVAHERGDHAYLTAGELDMVNAVLERHHFAGGMRQLIHTAQEIAEQHGLSLKATTDAKYLEVGLTTKADNVKYFLKNHLFPAGIASRDCAFWGDEFTYLGPEVKGSDAEMIIAEAAGADFFDVSAQPFQLPEEVNGVGGGVDRFLDFMKAQSLHVKNQPSYE